MCDDTLNLGQIQLTIKRIVGVAKPFPQGGVWRLTLPKSMVRKMRLNDLYKSEEFHYVFLETDKGLLLVPLGRIVNPANLREALAFLDLSGIDENELELLLEELTVERDEEVQQENR